MSSNTPTPPAPKYNDFQYVAAYATIIVLLYMFARTKFGYNTVYYMLAIFAFVLFLLNAKWIGDLLAPLGPNSTP